MGEIALKRYAPSRDRNALKGSGRNDNNTSLRLIRQRTCGWLLFESIPGSYATSLKPNVVLVGEGERKVSPR